MWTLLFPFAIAASLGLLEANAQSDFNYVGGVPLRTPGTCPAGSVVGQVTFEQNCCGADQTFVKVEGSVCCPDSTDCYDEVLAAPKCADPSWQLCGTTAGGFCCEADWVCWTQTAVGTVGGGVGCSTPSATLTAGLQSEVAIVYAANAGPGASTTTSPSAASSTSSGSQSTSVAKTTSGSQSLSSMSTTVASQSGTTSSSTSSSTSGSNSGGSSSEGSSSGSTATKKSSSLGGGPIAGIAIGALVLLVAAFAGGIWFSRKKNKSDPLMDHSRDSMWGKFKMPFAVSELGSTGHGRAELQAHVPGNGPNYVALSELPAHQQPVEMYAPYKRQGDGESVII